jgi:hypothetical protein
MNETDWKDLKNWPKDAKLLVNKGFFCKWVDGTEYNFFTEKGCWVKSDIQYEESEYNSGPWGCQYRPDPWSEGKERIENIARNSGEGEHYEADNVNHPEHYQSDNGIECIDAIRAALGHDGFIAYCRGNTIKYNWRSNRKGKPAEDLKKGVWYLNKAAAELEKND